MKNQFDTYSETRRNSLRGASTALPETMKAQVIRESRFGAPHQAFRVESVAVPEPKAGECLVAVMAAGINYNNVFASQGKPVSVISQRRRAGDPHDFHIGGSDGAGVVYKVGAGVTNVRVGDRVVLHGCWWGPSATYDNDQILLADSKAWGYETNFGSFAQYCLVQSQQCLPKPEHLTWEESAGYMVGGAAAYRMLFGFAEHRLQKGDVVLVWGGAGGVGSQAIQLVKHFGGIPVAVVSDDGKIDYCKRLGAVGVINRKNFTHWGQMPAVNTPEYDLWLAEARRFGKAIWDAVGERKNPRLVVEHSGEATLPTSLFVCERGGMVVTCGGTSGYNVTLDLRYHWMQQKRFQGSHFANLQQCTEFNRLVCDGAIDPCLGRVFSFEEIGEAHQALLDGTGGPGNLVALVGAMKKGLGRSTEN